VASLGRVVVNKTWSSVTRGLRVMREQLFNWVSTHDLELLESTLCTLRVALVRQGKANSI